MTKFTTTRDEFTGADWLQILKIIKGMNIHWSIESDRDKFVQYARKAVPKIVELIESKGDARCPPGAQKFELQVPVKLKGQMEAAVERYGFRVQSTAEIDCIARAELRKAYSKA